MTARIHLLLAALAASSALGQIKEGPVASAPGFEGVLVHEWGTFTSFSGPSGSIVPFNITLGENLPDFVQARQFGEGWTSVRNVDSVKFALSAEQRMETPVLYFYSDKPAELSVAVRMPNGLISEVYPPISTAAPATLPSLSIPAGGSSVRWDHVSIVPGYCCDGLSLPPSGDSHYFQARATKANPVKVRQGDTTFEERFLFYRGIGRGDMGLKARPLGHDEFIIDRSESGPLSAVFAVEVAGAEVRFAQAEHVEPGAKLTLPKSTTTADALGAAMAQSLQKAGLFADEAQAMVNTWKHLWFGEAGTRLMVIMPQPSIDKVLPLDIAPSPAEVKRVFVARLEVLTPERQQWTQDLLARQDAASDAQKQGIELELEALGRFRGPIIKIARDAAGKQSLRPSAGLN